MNASARAHLRTAAAGDREPWRGRWCNGLGRRLPGLQRCEQLERLWLMWKHIPPGGRVFGDGHGAPVDVIVPPVDGNLKGARDLRHRQETGEAAWMRLSALLKQPRLDANEPRRGGEDG
jgi:hypothetical protein